MKVTAKHLVDFAGTRLADELLGELVRRLIRATAKEVTDVLFPSGESTFRPGADGELQAKGMPPYIPDGYSIWELSTRKDIGKKANGDFDERSGASATDRYMNQPRCEITYVALTMRRWAASKGMTRAAFLKKALATKVWKDVKVIDADHLEAWLEEAPSVSAWLARRITGATDDLRGIEQYWDEYRLGSDPPMNEALLLAGRAEKAEQLTQAGLCSEVIRIKGDSPTEAAAFAAAAFLALNKENALRSTVLAKGIVISKRESIDQLLDASSVPYVIALGDAANSATMLAHRGFTVVVPVGNSNWSTRGSTPIELTRAQHHEFSQALTDMGLAEESASVIATRCNRSITVFRRSTDRAQTEPPSWASRGELRKLLGPIFCGAWNHTKEGDREILALVSGGAYPDIEQAVVDALLVDDAPLLRAGELTTLSAPADIWQICIDLHLIDDEVLNRFREAALTVLSEIDPALELSPDRRPYAALYGKQFRFSGWLRRGICEILRIIAVNDENLRHLAGFSSQRFIDELVRNIPNLGTDYRVMASLDSLLPEIAEASPDPFLDALEGLMGGDGKQLSPLFEGGDDPMFGHAYYLGVLRSLEMLAWDPSRLTRVCLDLARMAQLDPGGQLSNRPLNSLAEIFLPWNPHTNAGQPNRHAALEKICSLFPDIGWSLLDNLLPTRRDLSFGTRRPEWREFGASSRPTPTRQSMARDQAFVIDLARPLAGLDPTRWLQLIKAAGESHNGPLLADLLDELQRRREEIQAAGGGDEVWEGLRSLADKHHGFAAAQWAMSAELVELVRTHASHFQPEDPIALYKELFDTSRLHQREPDESFAETELRLNAERDVATGRLAKEGVERVLELARSIKAIGLLAASMVRTTPPGFCREAIISSFREDVNLRWLASLVCANGEATFGFDWAADTVDAAEAAGGTAEEVASLLISWDDKRSTLEFVSSLSDAIQKAYWSKRDTMVRSDDNDVVQRAIESLSLHNRNTQLIEFIGFRAENVSTAMLLDIVERAFYEVVSDPQRLQQVDRYWLRKVFDHLIERSDVDRDRLLSLEYRWLPAIYSYGEPKRLALHAHMAESPEFFVQVLSDLYKADWEVGDEEDDASSDEKPDTEAAVQAEPDVDQRRAKADIAYKLLDSWRELPGWNEDRTLCFETLHAWSLEVLRLAKDAGRLGVATREIGKLLAYAPVDSSDNLWPAVPVRKLIEAIGNDDLESGIVVELFNKRGAHFRPADGGGAEELKLAQEAIDGAEQLQAHWPRTAHLLRENAKQWRHHAEWEDRKASERRLQS